MDALSDALDHGSIAVSLMVVMENSNNVALNPCSFVNVWTDTRLPATTSQHQHKTHAVNVEPKPQPIAIVPATGWAFNDKEQVILTAYDPTNIGSQRSWFEPASCNQR